MGAKTPLALLAALALAATGCGGSTEGGRAGSKANTGAPVKGKLGGKVTFLAAADVDYLDPGQTYYTFGYTVAYATNRPLYSFKPDDASNPVPDLAASMPQISKDNKTITVKLRSGVRFAPPVNREVTSKDVKYAFERSFTANVPSGYATSYFADIVGAPPKPGAYTPIPGLKTPDDHTLVIELSKPTAVTVAAALVMPITMPVPKEYAQKFDKASPTKYDQYAVASGAYMVRNDSTGKDVGRDPGKSIDLVRNPNWVRSTDFRPAYLDEIHIDEGNDDLSVASRRTLSGQGLMCCDSGQPPIAILRRAITSEQSQLGRVSSGGSRWIALNTSKKPFDNLNVRKAVIAASDREALLLTRGGREVGPIAQGYIPPGVPGFEESGGEKGFPEFDWMRNPKGDPALAKQYMLKAKAEGVPVTADGKYAGGEKLLTIATNADPGLQTATVMQGQLQQLGFKLNFRKVPQDTLYTRFCNVPASGYVICPNVGWFRDFTDPESVLEPTFKGAAIKAQGNVNVPMLRNQAIDDAMTKAATIPAGPARSKAWAEINRMVVAQAPAIPYAWDDSFQLSSKDVQGVMNGYLTTWDLSYSSVK
ncbi:MAG: peptide/nickel transport system substrate-binding protein [Solirubrobacteraceae bacterium]|jgi:peptide/nickel transport system substrate-binding protein|nr:peptide/nickel transport system substrate-binding protein [Solirubrobacteraceae bacterium]